MAARSRAIYVIISSIPAQELRFMPVEKIPFNRPCFGGNEHLYMGRALERLHISGDGYFSKQAQTLLELETGAAKALLTTSCTDALEMSALLLEIGEGDEVIVPSFTFVSTANAYALRGARIRFADSRPDTLNMDERHVEALLTKRTKAIVPVHYAGVGCEMSALNALAERNEVAIIEDNAHGLFGAYRGRNLGTFGAMATQSFHETKNFSCGEGGALLLNDPALTPRAEILREKGTNRSQFFRGQVDKYTWVDVGSSFLPSDLLAACLLAQLERKDAIQSARKAIWDDYYRKLGAWAERYGVGLPVVPEHCEQTHHLFYLLMPTFEDRQAFIQSMKERGVMCVFHYLPLNSSPMGATHGGRAGDCPVSETMSDLLVRLPLFNNMTLDERLRVIEGVLAFQPQGRPHALLETRNRLAAV